MPPAMTALLLAFGSCAHTSDRVAISLGRQWLQGRSRRAHRAGRMRATRASIGPGAAAACPWPACPQGRTLALPGKPRKAGARHVPPRRPAG